MTAINSSKSSGNLDAFCTINEYAETYRSKKTFYSSQLILPENFYSVVLTGIDALKSSGNLDAFCSINEYAETYKCKCTFYSSPFDFSQCHFD